MNAELIKALLINAAYTGAVATCGSIEKTSSGHEITIDPTFGDAGVQAKGVMVYEQAKIQYHALLRAFHDKTGVWPDPKVEGFLKAIPESITSAIPTILKALTAGGANPLLALMPLLESLLPGGTTQATPLKTPGSDLK